MKSQRKIELRIAGSIATFIIFLTALTGVVANGVANKKDDDWAIRNYRETGHVSFLEYRKEVRSKNNPDWMAIPFRYVLGRPERPELD